MSIASVVGKAIAVDKATQERTRPSAARVKLIIDLLDKQPKKVKLQIVDRITGKYVVHYQEIVYDNLPKYCTYCKHQGHDEKMCRIMKEKVGTEVGTEEESVDTNLPINEMVNVDKLQRDARDYLNAKRTGQGAKDLQEEDGLKDPVGRIDLAAQPGFEKDVMKKAGDLKVAVNQTKANTLFEKASTVAKQYDTDQAIVVEGIESNVAFTAAAIAPVIPMEEALKLDKGPPKPSRDVPASTVFARMYLATAGALKTATDRASFKAQAGINRMYRAAGGHNNVSNDRVNVGTVSLGGKSGFEANISLKPNEGEQQKITRQGSDREVVAQTYGIEKGVNTSKLVENRTGETIEDVKVKETNTKEGVWKLVTCTKSPTKKRGSPKRQNQTIR